MKIRTKTLLAVGLTLLASASMTFGVSYLAFTRSLRNDATSLLATLRAEDERDARAALERFASRVSSELDRLEQRLALWTPRDDTYAYAQSRSAAFRRANLADAVMSQDLLSVLVVATETGAVVHRLYYDWDRRAFDRLPASVEALVQPGGLLQDAGSAVTGVLQLPEGTLLLASAPILPAALPAAPRGVFLIGRFLDKDLLYGLSGAAAATVTLAPVDSTKMPVEGVAPDGAAFVGYHVIRDMDGRPVLVARVVAPGASSAAAATLVSIQRTAVTQAVWLAAALLATLILVTGGALLHVEIAVHRRAADLGARLDAIAADPRIGERVVAGGDDELSLLEGSVNEVLAALETSRRDDSERARAQEAAARRARASLQATGQIAFELDTGSGRVHLEGAITRLTGHTAEELASIPISVWESMIHPEDRATASAPADPSAVSPYRVEYRLHRKDGGWVEVEERGVRAPNPPVRLVGIIRAAPRHV